MKYEWMKTYKQFDRPPLDQEDMLSTMHSLYGKSTADSDFNIVKFWGVVGDIRMQGFREAIEILEELDRANNNATDYIRCLKQLYDAHHISSRSIMENQND